DAIAEKLGIARNSIQRARAAVLYILERMSDEGHVYSPFEYLEGQFRTALEMEPDLAHDAVNELVASGEVIAEDAGDHIAIYLARLHEAEVNVATRIAELNAGRAMNKDLIDRAVAAAVKSSELELSAEQKSALRVALADVGLKPTLAAPTGRAARRLQEASGRDAKTIHRLLEYAPESGGFLRNKNFPLRTNYLIIDEASMMDVELASSLLSALMPNCSLLLVGDKD